MNVESNTQAQPLAINDRIVITTEMQNVLHIGQQRAADSLRLWLIKNNFTTRSLMYAMNIRAMNIELVNPMPEPNMNRIVRDMESLCTTYPSEPYAWGDVVPALRFFSETTELLLPEELLRSQWK
eukprot:GHVR01180843.1.p1 GENE.GHVR01180843.1~~GHVR01180843.1.p1  ORF type:complete len:125 (+),score=10.51 GHVR01180843.1:244-618(+)